MSRVDDNPDHSSIGKAFSNLLSTNAIYEGRIIYTPSSFFDLIPDYYKQKPISLYDPREAPLLNQYRLVVPRTRNVLEVLEYVVLVILYVVFMAESDHTRFSTLECLFSVYSFGWCLEQFATVLGHGWLVVNCLTLSKVPRVLTAFSSGLCIHRIFGPSSTSVL